MNEQNQNEVLQPVSEQKSHHTQRRTFTKRQNTVKDQNNFTNIAESSKTQKVKNKVMSKGNALKLTFLGGVGEIGKNMIALEYGNDMIVIDCGLTFPSDDMPGIDIVVPDITYLNENKDKIRAFIITHGHEDHIGAVPYVFNEINAPVYGSRLTLALIENKLREHKKIKFKGIAVKNRQKVKIGPFTIEFVKVTHSISGSFGFVITTPVGVYFHTGDFKLDLTPIDGEAMDLAHLGEIAQKGVLLMTADSTNAERNGFSMSEKNVGKTLDNIFATQKVKRIIIATFASNVHRVQQILDIAEKYGRKVTFTGRSMINICETASKIGELRFNKDNIIDISNIDRYPDNELVIITTGTQGEPASALSRMANDEFQKVQIGENDLVIFSSSSIPGNEKTINDVINQLYRKGAEVIYESLAEVHVSGHAYRDELKVLHSLMKPKFFIPCHGEYRHLRAHANLAQDLGMEKRNIMIPDLGNQFAITKNSMKLVGTVPSGSRLVDGLGVGDVGSMILRDRMQLAEEGVCVVIVSISSSTGALNAKPDIITRGFSYKQGEDNMLEEAKDVVINALGKENFKTGDWGLIKTNIRKSVTNFFAKKAKRRPLVLPIILEN